MQHLDIAELVRSALEVSGCDPSLIGGIDSHSTIVLDLLHCQVSVSASRTMMYGSGRNWVLTAWWYYNSGLMKS